MGLIYLTDPNRHGFGQTCKVCSRRDKFNFHVPDEIWFSIVPEKYNGLVVCLTCFDDFADKKGIAYAPYIDILHFVGDHTNIVFGANSYTCE